MCQLKEPSRVANWYKTKLLEGTEGSIFYADEFCQKAIKHPQKVVLVARPALYVFWGSNWVGSGQVADVSGQLKLFGQLKNFDGLFNFLEHVVDNFPDDRRLLSLPVLSPKPAITSGMPLYIPTIFVTEMQGISSSGVVQRS